MSEASEGTAAPPPPPLLPHFPRVPPPPPLPPPPAPGLHGAQLLKAALEQTEPGDHDGIRELLKHRQASFSEHLKWLLFNNPVPSLIQEGPQIMWEFVYGPFCNYSSIAFVFPVPGSAVDMARLATEVFPCQAELLSGGLEGHNHERIIQHLSAGFPVLIPNLGSVWRKNSFFQEYKMSEVAIPFLPSPLDQKSLSSGLNIWPSYDEDSNHEPCFRSGYKAHWAIASGALLGLKSGSQMPPCEEDKEISGLFHASPCVPTLPLDAVAETYLLSKQGKSCRYQLWNYTLVQESNAQLTDFSPKRAADGKVYIVPAGGVREGLCGKAVLLRPKITEGSNPNE
ncbi:hypothetical protein JD844_005826 [Phrynosoma platyrhinos]|uniref:Actin maturation protease n=1 Tax=Phrynosoma platyrhinos TaxID=52577 RepID=A0ABQ7TPS9_PHRPL|nr:hypothetical protein JD844_005826 [Phrynosoma platyrhinos]